jgi:hypothetical protein
MILCFYSELQFNQKGPGIVTRFWQKNEKKIKKRQVAQLLEAGLKPCQS